MRILYVNKFAHVNGGVDKYFFDLARLMETKGHKVALFATNSDPKYKGRWKKYFTDYVPFKSRSIVSRFRFMSGMFYSPIARKKISRIMDDFKPDLVHIHSYYHQLSPSVLIEIKTRKIPVIQSLGDFHIVAPNYNLFHQNRICEITKPDKYYMAIFHKCVKGSILASILEVLEKYFQKIFLPDKKYTDLFLVPSRFMKEKLAEFGFKGKKTKVLPHFTNRLERFPDFNKGEYILFFGRLSPEKGLVTLLYAMRPLSNIRLLIAGEGNQKMELEKLVRHLNLKNVEFTGFLDGERLKKLIRKSRFTVLPSLWYETFGLSIIESFALGKAVIAARIGGISEIISNGKEGFLFTPGDYRDLSRNINKLWNSPNLAIKMGKAAFKSYQVKFNPESHYKNIEIIYSKTIQKQLN